MIEIADLVKTFNPGSVDAVFALRGISLNIRQHEFVTVIGTNGSGKSTLLNAVAGSVLPDKGTIVIDGKDVTRKPDYQRAAMISRVFQNPYSGTAPDMTIAENLLMAWNRGRAVLPVIRLNRRLKNFFREQLSTLDMQLEERLDNVIGTLSGGQRQAITLLMALIRPPSVLLLDEHTAALDPKTANQVLRLTQRLIATHRPTTIMVTHSMKMALELGSRTLMMHNGRIIEDIDGDLKRSQTVEDLLARFEEIRKREKLTPDIIDTMRKQYL